MSVIENYPALRPTLLLDFANSGRVHPLIQCTRASTATYSGPDGVLRTVANNVPRIDFDPITGKCLGLLVEEQRTNSIRNNTMLGASAGIPGTMPTNWSASTPVVGLSREIVGVGVEDGIEYIDIRWSGTATASASGAGFAQFESATGIAAASAQTWTTSANLRLVGGSLTGVNNVTFRNTQRNSSGADVGALTSENLNVTNAPLVRQRLAASITLTNADTAFVVPFLAIGFSVGAEIDVTLRIGLPQIELGSVATSVIRTTSASTTRAADVVTMALDNRADITVALTWEESGAKSGFLWQMDAAGSGANRLRTTYTTTGGLQSFVTVSNLNSLVVVANPANIATGLNSAAVSFTPNSLVFGRNGVGGTADNSLGALPVTDVLRLGSSQSAIGQPNFRLRKLAIYKRALTQTQLQRLTTP